MELLKNILNNFVNLQEGFLLSNTMTKNPFLQDLVIELNTKGQLDKGILSNDEVLPDYSETSVIQFGKRRGAIRLFDSGEFWKSFDIIITNDGFIIDAQDEKRDPISGDVTELFKVYSINVLGLNDANTKIFIEELIPILAIELRNEIQNT